MRNGWVKTRHDGTKQCASRGRVSNAHVRSDNATQP
jgi:hypothetical protein